MDRKIIRDKDLNFEAICQYKKIYVSVFSIKT